MGVLDDAIRQHLELKRKHGAPEEELQRQEEEALGPARREMTAVEEAEPAGGDGELPDQAAPEAIEPEAAEPEAAGSEAIEPEAAEAAVPPSEQAPAEDPVAAAEEESPLEEPAAYEEDHLAGEPAAGQPAYPETEVEPAPRDEHPPGEEAFEPDPAEPRLRSGETPVHGFPALGEEDVEEQGPEDVGEHEDDHLEEDEEPGDAADVLEETPDFLEETPEHDRLWFEQKPPRDFDFD